MVQAGLPGVRMVPVQKTLRYNIKKSQTIDKFPAILQCADASQMVSEVEKEYGQPILDLALGKGNAAIVRAVLTYMYKDFNAFNETRVGFTKFDEHIASQIGKFLKVLILCVNVMTHHQQYPFMFFTSPKSIKYICIFQTNLATRRRRHMVQECEKRRHQNKPSARCL